MQRALHLRCICAANVLHSSAFAARAAFALQVTWFMACGCHVTSLSV
jgi:hypothetical protein